MAPPCPCFREKEQRGCTCESGFRKRGGRSKPSPGRRENYRRLTRSNQDPLMISAAAARCVGKRIVGSCGERGQEVRENVHMQTHRRSRISLSLLASCSMRQPLTSFVKIFCPPSLDLGVEHALMHSHFILIHHREQQPTNHADCLPPASSPSERQSNQHHSEPLLMSFTSILRTIIFNLGALAVAYVLLLSGVHKFTYKVR